ncbi:MAG: helix-turn-helix transcriptional regulator [Chitinophagaceae bacterium]|nr:helix-turn-helix transcriptional regulator [Chitinophagaceae bacterium]
MRSQIEQYIINRVREIRLEKRKSQADIAYGLGFESTGYIGEIESSNSDSTAAYNIDHLNTIAKLLECSPKDFWPEKPL